MLCLRRIKSITLPFGYRIEVLREWDGTSPKGGLLSFVLASLLSGFGQVLVDLTRWIMTALLLILLMTLLGVATVKAAEPERCVCTQESGVRVFCPPVPRVPTWGCRYVSGLGKVCVRDYRQGWHVIVESPPGFEFETFIQRKDGAK